MKYYIYKITSQITGLSYIGRTGNVKQRFHGHRSKLNTKTHPNKHFQADYDSYGLSNFTFEVLEEVDSLDEANVLEERYVTQAKEAGLSFNINYGGRRGMDKERYPFYGKTRTLETREKISNTKKGKTVGRDNHFYGRRHTDETKEMISKSRAGKAMGGDNPFARRVKVNGIIYGSVVEAREATGYKRYKFHSLLNDPNNPDFEYVD